MAPKRIKLTYKGKVIVILKAQNENELKDEFAKRKQDIIDFVKSPKLDQSCLKKIEKAMVECQSEKKDIEINEMIEAAQTLTSMKHS